MPGSSGDLSQDQLSEGNDDFPLQELDSSLDIPVEQWCPTCRPEFVTREYGNSDDSDTDSEGGQWGSIRNADTHQQTLKMFERSAGSGCRLCGLWRDIIRAYVPEIATVLEGRLDLDNGTRYGKLQSSWIDQQGSATRMDIFCLPSEHVQ